jgi:glycine cleavage system aminomethyltransferase T
VNGYEQPTGTRPPASSRGTSTASDGRTGGPQLELLVSSDQAVDLYDEMVAAGRGLGLRHAGSRSLDSLRVENGVRRVGSDVGPNTDPITAGLGHLVALDKPGGFRGHDALMDRAASPRLDRPVHVRLLDPAPMLRGGEAILRDGVGVGGSPAARTGTPSAPPVGWPWCSPMSRRVAGAVVECAGNPVPAEVADTPFYPL